MKALNAYNYQKLQRRFYINFNSSGNTYRIIVKDKRWHLWKTYAKSCFYEVINDIWETDKKLKPHKNQRHGNNGKGW